MDISFFKCLIFKHTRERGVINSIFLFVKSDYFGPCGKDNPTRSLCGISQPGLINVVTEARSPCTDGLNQSLVRCCHLLGPDILIYPHPHRLTYTNSTVYNPHTPQTRRVHFDINAPLGVRRFLVLRSCAKLWRYELAFLANVGIIIPPPWYIHQLVCFICHSLQKKKHIRIFTYKSTDKKLGSNSSRENWGEDDGSDHHLKVWGHQCLL